VAFELGQELRERMKPSFYWLLNLFSAYEFERGTSSPQPNVGGPAGNGLTRCRFSYIWFFLTFVAVLTPKISFIRLII
jgi:hypothetical protein